MGLVIGIDFDNTIAIYHEVIHRIALEQRLIHSQFAKNKKCIRDHIRSIDHGEILWQKIQSIIYGARMNEAELSKGFLPFMAICKENNFKTYVISHKTLYTPFDETQTNLRTAAMNWMESKGLFKSSLAVLTRNDVYFEDTRLDKLKRIETMKCNFFIDDLAETFLEPSFPANVGKILYAPLDHPTHHKDIIMASNWASISKHIFSTSN
ncbi:hypothetical protein D4S03_00685 [bacterium]|nr:MAG: hypothetical protein D4S03_00685 [bacterium]